MTRVCRLPRFAALPLVVLVAACEEPLDYDLRGQIGAFNTTAAAQQATEKRPKPDTRGLITYPSYQVAVARRGDTVADVATRAGLPAAEVARFNGVRPEDKLREDEVLILPRKSPTGTAGAVDIASIAGQAIEDAPDTTPQSVTTQPLEPAVTPKPPTPVQPGPEPLRHKVARGETAYTISRLYQVPVKSLAEWNGLGSDFAVREGQYLLIPVKDQKAPTPTTPVAASTTEPGSGTQTPTPPSASKPLPDEKISATPPEPPKLEVAPPTRSSSAEMIYPVQGKIIRTYSKGKNDGIDIAASGGAPVKAARSGTVAAIMADANQVPIVVIKHDANLLTVYANVEDIKVKKGAKVKQGQQIGQLEDSSNAYLHFEVRNGFDTIDPQTYLE
ncbi:MAG: peptidoglycan DD-metalloendopeptidase family protein [Rhodobacteraceae bacterium]|nr:peptidoglycan DD-metalloendopeptidase family protein [Paracoccaceae bacterium]